MNTGNGDEALKIPAIRGVMGDWVYYIGLLKMKDVAERIKPAGEVHSSDSLEELLQRSLSKRSEEIAEYLLTQSQRFFNALVVGTYGGNPNWFELAIDDEGTHLEPLPDHFEGTLGILYLDGTEQLWAINGQHRVAGIRQALEENAEVGQDELCVLFVAGVTSGSRQENPDGFERTRRLFTTLNRYAKPVSKKDIIALDEDDIVAIITRRLVERHELLAGRISIKAARSIPSSDRKSLTSIEVLYDTLDIVLRDRPVRIWNKRKTKRPSDDEIEAYYITAEHYFELLSQHFGVLREYRQTEGQMAAAAYRNENGGHLLFRPIGLLLITKVARYLIDYENESLEASVRSISQTPMELSQEPWSGLLWDNRNLRMLYTSENQKVARWLLFYIVGGNLTKIRVDYDMLVGEYAGILNMEKENIDLERFRL